MTNVVWLAAHATLPLAADRIERWADAVERTLPARLGSLARSAIVLDHIALVAWSDPAAVPRTWAQVESGPGVLAVSDGYPIGFDRLGVSAPSPLAIATALDADFALVDRLLPPYANATVRDRRLTVAIDALGFAKVYRAAADGVTAWSNSALLASLFTYGRADASDEGWVGLLAREAFVGDTSSLAGVTLETPRTSIRAADRPDGLVIERIDPIAPLRRRPPEDVAGAVAAAIASVYRSLHVLDLGRVTIPLSGGRDSRVLAAVALDQGTVDEFWTSSPPELDLSIATSLLDRLGRPIPWSTRDKTADVRRRDRESSAAGLTTAAIWERLVAYQAFTEGEGVVSPQTVPPRPSVPLEDVTVWGIGGEFGRAFYYDVGATLLPKRSVDRFWAPRRSAPAVVDPVVAHDLLAPRIDALRAWITAHGVTGLAELDQYYVFQRVRRLQNRIGTTSGIRPYFAVEYLAATMGQSPTERVRTRYYRDVVDRAYPSWAGIPYSHEIHHAQRDASTALSHALAFWDSQYVARLGADLHDLIAPGGILVRDQVMRSIRLGARPDSAVDRMRSFCRMLDHFAFLRFLDGVRVTFPADARAVAGATPAPVAWAVVRAHRSPLAVAAIRFTSRAHRVRARLEPRQSRLARMVRRLWARAADRMPVVV